MCADSLKICFISSQYSPYTIGGAGVYASCLCKELARFGHEVHAIVPCLNSSNRQSTDDGVHVHKVQVLNKPLLRTVSFWLRAKKVYKKIEEEIRPDILHSNVTSDLGLTKNSVKVPRVVTVHHLAKTTFEKVRMPLSQSIINPNTETGIISWIEKKTLDFDKIVIERANRIIAVSDFVKKSLISSYSIPSAKISVVYNGVYWRDFATRPNDITTLKKLYNLKDKHVILYVGRIEPRKGINLLLEAFSILSRKTKRKCRLFMVGKGNKNRLWRMAQKLKIKNKITLIDEVSFDTLRKIYCLPQVFVMPSLLEGFGLTLLEAMAAGKPVVALKVGGIPEIVKDGINGKLVDGDPVELASALKFFIENPRMARKIGERNRRYVAKNFGWEKTARKTLDVYCEVLN